MLEVPETARQTVKALAVEFRARMTGQREVVEITPRWRMCLVDYRVVR